MMPVSAVHRDTPLQIDPERSAEQRLLEIVDGNGIPAQQGLDVPLPNKTRKVFPGSGMDHHRAGHDNHLAPARTEPPQSPGNLPPHHLHPPLARNPSSHETEFLARSTPLASGIARFGLADRPDATNTHNDLLSRRQV